MNANGRRRSIRLSSGLFAGLVNSKRGSWGTPVCDDRESGEGGTSDVPFVPSPSSKRSNARVKRFMTERRAKRAYFAKGTELSVPGVHKSCGCCRLQCSFLESVKESLQAVPFVLNRTQPLRACYRAGSCRAELDLVQARVGSCRIEKSLPIQGFPIGADAGIPEPKRQRYGERLGASRKDDELPSTSKIGTWLVHSRSVGRHWAWFTLALLRENHQRQPDRSRKHHPLAHFHREGRDGRDVSRCSTGANYLAGGSLKSTWRSSFNCLEKSRSTSASDTRLGTPSLVT